MIEELADWGGGGGEVVAPNEKILIVTGSFHTTESSIEVVTCLLHIWEGQSLFLNSTCSVGKGSHLPLLISHRGCGLVNCK